MQENLPELRDIHLPEGISIFPPAYGWWVILACVFLAVFFYKLFFTVRKKSKKIYALNLLNKINTGSIVPAAIEISEILRRICVYKYPAANAKYGKEWILFLNSHATKKIDPKTAELLINAPYIKKETSTYTQKDIIKLTDYAKNWIGENL